MRQVRFWFWKVVRRAADVDPIPAVGQLGYFQWKAGGEIDTPKPWMVAWPEEPTRRKREKAERQPEEPAPMPLFQ